VLVHQELTLDPIREKLGEGMVLGLQHFYMLKISKNVVSQICEIIYIIDFNWNWDWLMISINNFICVQTCTIIKDDPCKNRNLIDDVDTKLNT
jgi:hypothetical protein